MGLWDRLRRRTPEEAFTAEVAAMVRRVPGVEEVGPGDDELSLRVGGRGPFGGGVMLLTNLFLEVRGLSNEDRRAAIAQFVEVVARQNRVPDDWEEARPRLFPAVRAAGFLGGHGGDERPVSWWVAPFLVELVAIDFDGVMTFANRTHIARWGVDADTVRSAAHHNLTTGGMSVIAADDLPGGWWIAGPDSYESSWLAVPEWLFEVAATRVEGEPLVIVPARSRAVIIGDGDPSVVAAALDWAEDGYRNEPRPLSPIAYRWNGEGLAVWRPEAGHPAHTAAEHARRALATVEYSEQKAHLDRLLEAAGEDVFVASIGLAARADGTEWSWAVWAKDVTETLLPEADMVVLHDDGAGNAGSEGEFLLVPWDVLFAEAGDHLTEEAGWGLTRWRVTGWPSPATLARLRSHAVKP